jgi:hypothetical protein
MITVFITILAIVFALASIGPLLVADETSDVVAKNEYRTPSSNPCSE